MKDTTSEAAQPGVEENTITVPDAQVTAPTKSTFGFASFNKATPESARNFFDMYFIVSKALIGWLAAVHILTTEHQAFITLTITLLLDVIVKGLTKMFGVTIDDDANKLTKN